MLHYPRTLSQQCFKRCEALREKKSLTILYSCTVIIFDPFLTNKISIYCIRMDARVFFDPFLTNNKIGIYCRGMGARVNKWMASKLRNTFQDLHR